MFRLVLFPTNFLTVVLLETEVINIIIIICIFTSWKLNGGNTAILQIILYLSFIEI